MVLELFRLDGRVAVVTAASRGIGAGIAEAFAEAGADVAIAARTRADLEAVAARVEAHGRRALVHDADLADRDAMAGFVDAAVDAFGRIDIVVNNAGGSFPKPFLETSERMFQKSLEWNVTSAFNLTQLAAPHLLERDTSAVINIASAAGVHRSRGFLAYGTAKAAMIALTENLAQDLAPRIRVNAIAPGAIATSALELVTTDENLTRLMIEGTPMRRIGSVADIAAAAVYLASDASAYVTGRILQVDGGIRGPNLELGMPDLTGSADS